jgi:hypothetical protein
LAQGSAEGGNGDGHASGNRNRNTFLRIAPCCSSLGGSHGDTRAD